MPINEMPYLKKYSKPCPNAAEIYNKGLCLPSSTMNDVDTIKRIAEDIKWKLS